MIFKDLEGGVISDPAAAINTINESFNKDHIKKIDYAFMDSEARIGGAVLWGKRENQEDRVSIGHLDIHLAQLDPIDEVEPALINVTDCLQRVAETFYFHEDVGSTFCAMLQSGDAFFTVNVGDSLAYVCEVEETKFYCQQINELHHPTTEKEAARLAKLDVCAIVEGGYLGGLAVSRALGDNRIQGLSHEPDVYHTIIKSTIDRQVVLAVATDGLTASKVLDEAKIGHIIANNMDLLPDELAKKITQGAIKETKEKHPDNMAVCVMPFNPKAKGMKYIAAFDGHGSFGGHKIADIASQIFPSVLEMYLLQEKLKAHVKSEQHPVEFRAQLITLLKMQSASFQGLTSLLQASYEPGNTNDEKQQVEKLKIYFASQASMLRLVLSNIDHKNESQKILSACRYYLDLHLVDIKQWQNEHCPINDFFLKPIYLARQQLAKIGLAAASFRHQQLPSQNEKPHSFQESCIRSYQQANVLLSIRLQYNAEMPSSFIDTLFKFFKDDEERKKVIEKIEKLAEKVVTDNVSIDDKLQHIRNEFESQCQQTKLSSIVNQTPSLANSFLQLFYTPVDENKKLLNCIDSALLALQKLNPSHRLAS